MKSHVVAALAALAPLLVGCLGAVGPSNGTNRSPAPGNPQPEVRALYLREVDAPRVVRVDDPILLAVRGDLPSPGWKFLRWDVRVEESDGAAVTVVTPLIAYTLGPGEAVPQVLVPHEGEARIDPSGAIGVRTIEVRGANDGERIRRDVEVVERTRWLDIEVTGGIAGIRRRVAIGTDGAVFASRSTDGRSARGRLGDDEMRAIRDAVDSARLPQLESQYVTENAADLFFHDIVDLSGARPVRVVADDLAMPDGFRRLATLVETHAANLLDREN